MGLAGPRNRRKIDHDPNNTKWTRDETTFGQKILRAQGWEPGKYLGAQDTAHAQLHSVASLAPIKVSLKDDTLGLGAKIRQKLSDECTGLDVFKDLLGRLNGKSEETLDKERQVRSVIKTNLVAERKYGPMRFVSGGLLVGDHIKMAELADNKPDTTPIKKESRSEASETEDTKREKKEKKQKKSKKRKASEAEAEEVDGPDGTREKKRKKRSKVDEEEELGSNDAEVQKPTKKEKSKKEKKSKRPKKDSQSGEPEGKVKKSKKSKKTSGQDSLSNGSTGASEDAASEKATKKEKEKKKKKKNKKREQADGIEAGIPTISTASSTVPQDSGSSTPSNASAPTPHALSARHRARSRHIASKKLAFGDMQALNQIFMIKPV